MSKPVNHPDTEVSTLIDQLLAEQRRLTAVERFAQKHAGDKAPSLASHFRELIPLETPRPGEQYAFEVDLDECSGCKGCVTACHSLNGLDEGESWRSVGSLVGEATVTAPAGGHRVVALQQTVTTACHHCVEPACLLGCPVLAYDKDPVTGIVRHLDDQCIGCSYCILKCPYEVPQYSKKRGIVRKCDMCHGRLAEGEAPACVQACPNSAIKITRVSKSSIVNTWAPIGFRKTNGNASSPTTPETVWLADAPEPGYTQPTTRYRSAQLTAPLRAADHFHPRPAHAHWPLILLLVLTQAGLGVLVAAVGLVPGRVDRPSSFQAGLGAVGAGLFLAGLIASVFHLGQPRKAWRAWLGWRTSWLSREAIALHVVAGLVTGLVVYLTQSIWRDRSWIPTMLGQVLEVFALIPPGIWLGALLAAVLFGVGAQTMVYADTRRHFWRFRYTGPRFFGTVLLFSIVAALLGSLRHRPTITALGCLGGALAVKFLVESAILKFGDPAADRWTQLNRSAQLLWGPLRRWWALRWLTTLGGATGIAWVVGRGGPAIEPILTGVFASFILAGELLERFIFFAAVSPDKMPGQAH